MFSLRCWRSGGVIKQSSNAVFRQSTKLRSHARRTLCLDSRVIAHGRYSGNGCIKELFCRLYSNEVNEVKQEMINAANVGEETVDPIFKEISNGDPQVLRKLKLLQFEIEVFKQTNVLVPENIEKDKWEYLLTLNSLSARKKYLSFLFKNEKKALNRKEKKRLNSLKYLLKKEEGVMLDPLSYNLSNQTLFLRIYNKTLSQILPFRNLLSEDIAQHIVFDCSYQEYMSHINTKYCAMQLLHCLYLNYYHHFPCFIRLCNFKKTDELGKVLPRYIQNVYNEDFPWTMHEESYLDFYSRDQLVYLTPHCNESLKLSPGDVYIIGAFVDKGVGVKASLARAKKYKLRMAKLPLDEHIQWKQGTKSLPLNIVLNILMDMKLYNNWPIALKNVPRRHFGYSDLEFNCTEFDDIIV